MAFGISAAAADWFNFGFGLVDHGLKSHLLASVVAYFPVFKQGVHVKLVNDSRQSSVAAAEVRGWRVARRVFHFETGLFLAVRSALHQSLGGTLLSVLESVQAVRHFLAHLKVGLKVLLHFLMLNGPLHCLPLHQILVLVELERGRS